MNTSGWLQLGLYVVVLLALAKPLGAYMAAVYEGRALRAQRIGGPLERLIYRGAGVDSTREMGWIEYALAMLWFNLAGALVVYGLQRLQQWLPLNPQAMAAVSPDSAFNTATSFATNTNWQGYGGETTMSYLTQMLGLAVQNFVSAATGMAVLVALIRGFARKEASGIGNFWTDLVRTTVYILLPLSIVLSLVLVSQGVPQTFDKYATVTLVQPVSYDAPKAGPDGAPLKDDKGNPVTEKRDRDRADAFRSVPPRRRSRSSSSAPTAAASTTSIRHTRSKTRRRSPTFSKCWRSCSSARRSATRSAR